VLTDAVGVDCTGTGEGWTVLVQVVQVMQVMRVVIYILVFVPCFSPLVHNEVVLLQWAPRLGGTEFFPGFRKIIF